MENKIALLILLITFDSVRYSSAQIKPEIINCSPFVWESAAPADCPFEPSKELTGIKMLGIKSGFHYGDTWYPTWGADGNLYSPWTDGTTNGVRSWSSGFSNNGEVNNEGDPARKATTGQAVIYGNDPMSLKVDVLGLSQADPYPYGGRYPCGSLIHKGIWYYGTYCLSPYGITRYGDKTYNWPQLGPFVGFRYSEDFGKTWTETPHTPSDPIFNETGLGGYPVKIGSPHFVDFGKNMEYSPDGKAYLVAHGSDEKTCQSPFYHNSWITGDQIYLIRLSPTIENINDPSKFFSQDGKIAWLLYSGNYATDWNDEKIIENPPGSHYGMVFQKIEVLINNKEGSKK